MRDLEQQQSQAVAALRARDSLLRNKEEHIVRQQARLAELDAAAEKSERVGAQVRVRHR